MCRGATPETIAHTSNGSFQASLPRRALYWISYPAINRRAKLDRRSAAAGIGFAHSLTFVATTFFRFYTRVFFTEKSTLP